MTYNLTDLTEEELNLILNGVAQLPYIKVWELIQKIQRQAASDISAKSTE